MEIIRQINGKEYTITVEFEHRNVPSKRWVAYCKQVDLEEEVGANPNEAVRKLEIRIIKAS
ncbi:MAG: hypothetical protein ACOX3A_10140 [bacterium]|jgi:hypothetical protein